MQLAAWTFLIQALMFLCLYSHSFKISHLEILHVEFVKNPKTYWLCFKLIADNVEGQEVGWTVKEKRGLFCLYDHCGLKESGHQREQQY